MRKGIGPSQLQHLVQDMDGDGNLHGTTAVLAKRAAGHRSSACIARWRPRRRCAYCCLTSSASPSCPSRRCIGGGRHAASARFVPSPSALPSSVRHDDRCVSVAVGDSAVGAVGRGRGRRSRHLVEQGANLAGVTDIVHRHCGEDDLPRVGVHAGMQLPAGSGALLQFFS